MSETTKTYSIRVDRGMLPDRAWGAVVDTLTRLLAEADLPGQDVRFPRHGHDSFIVLSCFYEGPSPAQKELESRVSRFADLVPGIERPRAYVTEMREL